MAIESVPDKDKDDDFWRSKILHVLSIYPKISPSMLQVALGTSVPPRIWRGILESLTRSGVIIQTDVRASFEGSYRTRSQNYRVITLADPKSTNDVGLNV